MTRRQNCLEPELQDDSTDSEAITCVLDVIIDPTTVREVHKAILRLKNGKAAGVHHPAGTKYLVTIVPVQTRLRGAIWKVKTVPAQSQNGIVLPVHMKGDLSDCNIDAVSVTLLPVSGNNFFSVPYSARQITGSAR